MVRSLHKILAPTVSLNDVTHALNAIGHIISEPFPVHQVQVYEHDVEVCVAVLRDEILGGVPGEEAFKLDVNHPLNFKPAGVGQWEVALIVAFALALAFALAFALAAAAAAIASALALAFALAQGLLSISYRDERS